MILLRSPRSPAVNQIELHPYFTQNSMTAVNSARGIVTEAWSPLGGIHSWGSEQPTESPLSDPATAEIATHHGRSPVRIVLSWHRQHGRIVIPKSSGDARIRENFAVGDFSLS
ncbi:aldo/keto reductase [Kribbella speibonae]|uniref:Aldo/keto reductase n=1 Tax=Kribbella speibonae TaxID=1572660 RepID=A0A4V2M4L5_9ACTN|nr:aldo/keto reductase [Kribbella speibonae]